MYNEVIKKHNIFMKIFEVFYGNQRNHMNEILLNLFLNAVRICDTLTNEIICNIIIL